MYPRKIDGRLQVTSAISLLEFSRLVKWDQDSAKFTSEDHEASNSLGRPTSVPSSGGLSAGSISLLAQNF